MRNGRIAIALAVALAVSQTACRSNHGMRPIPFDIVGTVRYQDGQPVAWALVSAGGRAVFTRADGSYRLSVRLSPGLVRVTAKDGYDPRWAYAVTCSGSGEVRLRLGEATADIVLDSCGPV